MQPFSFVHADNKQTAIQSANKTQGAKFIGGGTNLVDLMKFYVENPSQIIDINALTGMDKIEILSNGNVRVGSLVRNSDLAYNDIITSRYPLLSQALLSGASAQLRNRATVGGNLLQRTRCPYFYDIVFACNKRSPGSGCSALNGYNRSNAVLGTSDKCIATHPSDMCVALVALDAIISVEGINGERKIPIKDFHLLPGDTPEKETSLQHDELITAIEIPNIPFARISHYLKVRDRASYEFALASAAVALDIKNNIIQSARVALGGIATKPWRATKAENILIRNPANEKTYQAAADAALAEAKPYQHNAFKIELAKRTLVRALSITGEMI
jgi:xanthine dehydrogenase YagS FAD-binding subunit